VRVFVDACIDPRIVEIIVGHEVRTAFDLGWQSLKDHVLLPKVAAEFDVLLTADQGFEFEHNLRVLTVGIVILHAPKNRLENYREMVASILESIRSVSPGEVVHVRHTEAS
jgi:hypothetical protein